MHLSHKELKWNGSSLKTKSGETSQKGNLPFLRSSSHSFFLSTENRVGSFVSYLETEEESTLCTFVPRNLLMVLFPKSLDGEEIKNFPAKPGILILDKTHSDVFVT